MVRKTSLYMAQSMTTIRRKFTVQTLMAFVLVVFGMVMVMCSLYMPPIGEIHPSVITVFGMILVAAGAFIGVDLNFQLKYFAEALRNAEKKELESAKKEQEADKADETV